MTDRAGLDGLFNPRSVAVIGASATPGKWGYEYARQLLEGAARREVFLVNQRGDKIYGQTSHTSILDLPRTPELAVICVPAQHVPRSVDDALTLGTRFIVCVTAGFKESGEEGRRAENAMRERIRAAGARLVGPNCVGLYDASAQLSCTAFWDLPPGDIGIISQSGGVIVDLGARLPRERLGVSRAVSVGNQADLTVAEFVEAFALDPNTRIIAAYIEEFREGRRLFEAIAFARGQGKEVVLVAPRAGEAVSRSVASHTGSMISNEDVLASICTDLDALRVRGLGDLVLALRGLSAPCRARGRRIAVLADGGGSATLGTDAAVAEGLEVPAFSDALVAKLRQISPGSGLGNPVDLVGALDLAVFEPVVREIAASGEVSAILMNGAFNNVAGAAAEEEAAVAARIRGMCADAGLALAVASMMPEEPAMRALGGARIPISDFPDAAARALSLGRQRQPLRKLVPLTEESRFDRPADYLGSRLALGEAGVPFGRAVHAADPDSAARAAAHIGYPVVLKALGSLHKSDSGSVVLGIADEAALRAAVIGLQDKTGAREFSVEEMVIEPGGIELLVGGIRDPAFGPTVVVAAGGTRTEIWRDRAMALAPVDMEAARRMLGALRIAPLFNGFRGGPPIDRDGVVAAIVAVSQFMARHPNVAEAEINPLIAGPKRAIAVDARIVLAG